MPNKATEKKTWKKVKLHNWRFQSIPQYSFWHWKYWFDGWEIYRDRGIILCVKRVRTRSYSGTYFFGTYFFDREILCISPYSVRMRENADQNNSEYGHFLHSDIYIYIYIYIYIEILILFIVDDCSIPWLLITNFRHWSISIKPWKHQETFSLFVFRGIVREYRAKMG